LQKLPELLLSALIVIGLEAGNGLANEPFESGAIASSQRPL
jgi:hypothetical protein